MKTPTEAVLKDYAEELLAAVPFPVERKWCAPLLAWWQRWFWCKPSKGESPSVFSGLSLRSFRQFWPCLGCMQGKCLGCTRRFWLSCACGLCLGCARGRLSGSQYHRTTVPTLWSYLCSSLSCSWPVRYHPHPTPCTPPHPFVLSMLKSVLLLTCTLSSPPHPPTPPL